MRFKPLSATVKTSEKSDPSRCVQFLEVPAHADGQRIDNFLMTRLKGVPRSHIYRLIRKGEVRVNKKRVKAETRIQTADLVRLPPVRVAVADHVQPPSEALIALLRDAVLYENEQILVINKPQGLAVHMGSGLQTGLIEAIRWIRSRDADEAPYLELAHRIDKETSGCILIAKNPLVLKHLQAEFKVRNVQKSYQLIVHGKWPHDLLEVNAPLLRRDSQDNEKIVTVSTEGKPSITRFKILEQYEKTSFIEAIPLSGRTHQIRVHAQHAGHPIVGDPKYTNRLHSALDRQFRLCLHAASLSFRLAEGEQIKVSAPLQQNMSQLLETLHKSSKRFS